VLFTESAWAAAERASRRGGDADPPVESGAVLAGTLCSCPESGEMFCIVTDAFEATDAQAQPFSLAFTGRTWAAIAAVLAARRRQPDAPPLRLLGSAHGHNFLPAGGAPPCAACASAPVCTRSSAVLSPEDESWTESVFHGQPWQLALVFGLTARSDRVAALYGLHGGRLRRRGLHLLPDAALHDRAPRGAALADGAAHDRDGAARDRDGAAHDRAAARTARHHTTLPAARTPRRDTP
jgi:hypothetical protein